jgi:hypothetical protein
MFSGTFPGDSWLAVARFGVYKRLLVRLSCGHRRLVYFYQRDELPPLLYTYTCFCCEQRRHIASWWVAGE